MDRTTAAAVIWPYPHRTCAEVFAEEDHHACLDVRDSMVRGHWHGIRLVREGDMRLLRHVRTDRS